MGRDLTTLVINYPTLWTGEVIKSPPMTLLPHRGSCGDLIIQISYLENHFKGPYPPPLGQVFCSKLRKIPLLSPHVAPGGIVGQIIDRCITIKFIQIVKSLLGSYTNT